MAMGPRKDHRGGSSLSHLALGRDGRLGGKYVKSARTVERVGYLSAGWRHRDCSAGSVWPRVRALAQSRMPEHVAKEEAEWTWPKTLRVCPAHAGDPVKLIKITKGGVPLEPGKYELPRIAGDDFENPHAVLRWLGDVAFTLRSEAPKNIVSVGIAVMLPVRRIDVNCISRIRDYGDTLCRIDPHWCDGGCPGIRHCTLHWGLIPAVAASGLRSRHALEYRTGEMKFPEGRNALLRPLEKRLRFRRSFPPSGWWGE